jgi:hypothetical protein
LYHTTKQQQNLLRTEKENQKLRASYFCKNSKQAMSKNKEINPDPIDSDIHLDGWMVVKLQLSRWMMSLLRHKQTSLRVRQKKACQVTCSKKAHTGTRILRLSENENAIFYFEVLLVAIQPLRILYVFASI